MTRLLLALLRVPPFSWIGAYVYECMDFQESCER